MGIDRYELEHRNWRWPKPTEEKGDPKDREKKEPSIIPVNDFQSEDSKADEKAD